MQKFRVMKGGVPTVLFCNPFFACIWAFSAAFALYVLRWSDLYPPITQPFLAFFFCLFLLFLLLGLATSAWCVSAPAEMDLAKLSSPAYLVVASVLMIASLLHNQGIPLLQVLRGDLDYAVYKYGIPGLHVFMLAFLSFYALASIDSYLITRQRIYLLGAGAVLGYFILIISRSAATLLIANVMFLFLLRTRVVSFAGTMKRLCLVLVVLFLFGSLGDRRIAFQIEQETGVAAEDIKAVLYDLADASDEFRNSGISPTILWPYLYISSPMANLQNVMTRRSEQSPSAPALLVVGELLPDSLSEKLIPNLGLAGPQTDDLISESLNVGTQFFSSFAYLGWLGLAIITAFFSCLGVAYLYCLRHSPFKQLGISVLCTVMVFGIFDNMWAYTPLSLQLFFPILMAAMHRR